MPWNKPGRLNPDDDNNPTPVERREQEKPPHNPSDLQTLLRQGGQWMGDRLRRHPRVSEKKGGWGTFTHRYHLMVALLGLCVFFLSWHWGLSW